MKKDGAKSLGQLLKKVIKDLRSRARVGEEEMAKAWVEAAGEKAARHSKPRYIRRAELVVVVDGSGWLYELTVEKRKILSKLKEILKDVKLRGIRFRIGEIK